MVINWLGLIISFASIIGGNALEGGHLSGLIQPTAALIVFGGTLGATMLASTMEEFSAAISSLKKVLLGKPPDFAGLAKEILEVAGVARKEGLLALEKSIPNIKNPFFAENLRHVVDGYDPTVLRDMMEERIFHVEEEKMLIAKVWETAGGFSPTVGIIGAVLGLIHVMSNLSDSSKLGAGIAVAFVATVYGVASANLVFLPIGTKLKKIGKSEVMELNLICTGLISIQSGLNPRVIEDKLNNLLGGHGGGHGEEEKKAA